MPPTKSNAPAPTALTASPSPTLRSQALVCRDTGCNQRYSRNHPRVSLICGDGIPVVFSLLMISPENGIKKAEARIKAQLGMMGIIYLMIIYPASGNST
ncbi:hypothetical protein PCI56_00845 [Plesiomonas shigelloides subsp. oncorhynchi]|nr:hypothetical protein [Plesiomonas shigelloides]